MTGPGDDARHAPTPLGEVFGYTPGAMSAAAIRARSDCICPFNNGDGMCRKASKDNPLGVCTIVTNRPAVAGGQPRRLQAICPHRFRQGGIVYRRLAAFFFGVDVPYRVKDEVPLRDGAGKAKGNFDAVLVRDDGAGATCGEVPEYGTVEFQSVYISGNIRDPFDAYMRHPGHPERVDWSAFMHPPRPDNRSAGPKRLIPQLQEKATGPHTHPLTLFLWLMRP